jgi:hypothetical protein
MRLREVCLPGRNLETDCVTPLFHCWYVYYLETADSVAQPFLHGANTPQYEFSLFKPTENIFFMTLV